MRLGWDETTLRIARELARRSTCLRVPDGVGAVLVESKTHRFLGTGYAGSLPGQPHCVDVGCLKIGDDPACHRTVHAETNALLFARSYDGPKTLYSTLSPCIKCLQHAIVVNVRRVVFSTLYRIHEPQVELCRAAGVEWVHHELT